ncbi:ABC transporter permease [Limosilactobacillus viscerum]|uniref:ABC transporter permease n=1 Tax=Limosilactobacillus viscerum TaxID=2993450 RepID=UPI0024B93C6A|nr:ABC transporter permease [Limosilactobacillus viscerum]
MFLALKEIKHEKLRYGLIIAMIVMISYLMFVLMGMMLGLANENKAAIDTWDTQTVYLNKNANDNMSQSLITSDQLKDKKLNGHEALVGQAPVVMKKVQGKSLKESAQFIGLNSNQYIAQKNIPLAAGRHAKNSSEIVVDESLKAKGYQLGDKVKLNSSKEQYKIVGFAKNSQLNVAPVVYGRLSTWKTLRGVAPQVVASGIISNQSEGANRFNDLEHYTANQFIQKLPGYSAQNNTFAFMIGFLMVISLVIIAVFLYILTMQKMPNYAVLRAQGIPARYLVGTTIHQAVILMVAGICGGLILTLLTTWLMPMTVALVLDWPLIALMVVVLILLGVIGALLPVRMILKIDPVRALNG